MSDIDTLKEIINAYAEIEGMRAENIYRENCDQQIAYGEEAFLNVLEKYGLVPNKLNKCCKCGKPIEKTDEWLKSGAYPKPTEYYHEVCI
jgi:hypothetical protein